MCIRFRINLEVKHSLVHFSIDLMNRSSLSKRVVALYSFAAIRISLTNMDHTQQLRISDNDAKLYKRTYEHHSVWIL